MSTSQFALYRAVSSFRSDDAAEDTQLLAIEPGDILEVSGAIYLDRDDTEEKPEGC